MDFRLDLPFHDPVVVFTLLLLVILVAPILFGKVKVPSIIGLILSGTAIGPYGLNLIDRSEAIVLFGTVGLLYIMFLAGLEIDLAEFKKNKNKSFLFGFFSFSIPMGLGYSVFYYAFGYSAVSSILVASMFASHTLITYPIVTKFDITKNLAVNVAIGGTLIVNLAALMVLAVVVASTKGALDLSFWLRMGGSLLAFSLVVLLVFPRLSRWFFKYESDSVAHYIFVLAVVFVSAFLAMLANIEAIIGAFPSGFALNKLIARNSPLMSRIEFVGNSLFIPIFLIGVGMLVDYRVLLGDRDALVVALAMSVVATVAKFAAAFLPRRALRMTKSQALLIFGLTNSQAASTLAAVLIGFNIILGQTPEGQPIRLLDENILNGTILMILVTCTIASFATQKSAIAIAKEEPLHASPSASGLGVTTLVGIANEATVESLMEFALNTKNRRQSKELYGLHIITADRESPETIQRADKLIGKAQRYAASADFHLHTIIRYDLNIAMGIINTVKEKAIRHFFIGLHEKSSLMDTFFGNLTHDLLEKSPSSIFIYKACQPLNTIQSLALVMPENAEFEHGFLDWYQRVLELARNTGCQLRLFARPETQAFIQREKLVVENMSFEDFHSFDHLLELKPRLQPNCLLILAMARKAAISFEPGMRQVSGCLSRDFREMGFVLVYPNSFDSSQNLVSYQNVSVMEDLKEMKDSLLSLLRREAPHEPDGRA